MIKWIYLTVIAFFSLCSSAQIQGEDEVYLDGDRIEAKFNGGGMEEFNKFVNREFDNSKVTKPGKMVAAFTIDIDGSIKNIKMIQMIDTDSAMEMIRVLNNCPRWKPATRGGKPISIEIKYPMVFNERKKQPKEKPLAVKEATPDQVSPISGQETVDNNAVESKPEFPGGVEKFYSYVATSFRVPKDRDFKGGKLIVSFVVEKDGRLTEMKVIQDIGFGTAKEAFRILERCPKWKPGMQNGKPVRVIYTLPLNLQPNS